MHTEEHTHLREIYKPPLQFNCIQRDLQVITESQIHCIKKIGKKNNPQILPVLQTISLYE